MKKFGLLTLLVLVTVLLTLAFSAAIGGTKASAAAAPAVVAPAAAVAMPAPPPHPHIHEGLEAMRSAKHHLESADHDFDGHRAKAIEHLDMAIHEAEICMSMP
jgi:hypothetical protein